MDALFGFFEAWGSTLLVLSLSLSALLLCLPTRRAPAKNGKVTVVVLVLGDIGRSPRMQHHALSIARKGGTVHLVGYQDSLPRPELLTNASIHIHPLSAPPRILKTDTPISFLIFAPLKALYQIISLLHLLLYKMPPSVTCLLLQTPPAIPTLAVAKVVSILRGTNVIIDWHNFGWSILALKLGGHPIVHFAKMYERVFGSGAAANFVVTDAMGKILKGPMGIKTPVKTLYDRPPSHFIPLSPTDRQKFLESHPATAPHAVSILNGTTKLLISSTSWTPDEDFNLLLTGLLSYDRHACGTNFLAPNSAPAVLAIITGKGPMREAYMAAVEKIEMQFVNVKTAWLESEVYPVCIGAADLGVCLHTSSSGVDLPMKVVDLFGVGVPVVAVGFPALGELVKHGENGLIFKDGDELGNLLIRLFAPASKELERLKTGAMKETEHRWDENWDKVAAPVFGLDGN